MSYSIPPRPPNVYLVLVRRSQDVHETARVYGNQQRLEAFMAALRRHYRNAPALPKEGDPHYEAQHEAYAKWKEQHPAGKGWSHTVLDDWSHKPMPLR